MYFEDLTLCMYGNLTDARRWQVPLRAVGWLERPHPFAIGTANPVVRARLQALIKSFRVEFWAHGYCGLHGCTLYEPSIPKRLGSEALPGSENNLFVPGDGCVYATPTAVGHYIDQHGYLPPAAFCDAVLQCPDPATPEYRRALTRANANKDPFACERRVNGQIVCLEFDDPNDAAAP